MQKQKEFTLYMVKCNVNNIIRASQKDLLIQSVGKRMNYDQIHYDFTQRLKKRMPSIEVNDHGWERWNERIGPHASLDEINNRIQALYREPERIVFLSHEFGMIDNEIVFTYMQKKKTVVITTFYGRISLQPALADIDYLKYFNERYQEKLGLFEDNEVLSRQLMPPVPKVDMSYRGRWTEYKIEEYALDNNEKVVVIINLGGKASEPGFILVDEDQGGKIGKSGKKALKLFSRFSPEMDRVYAQKA
ncbi:hypothetical protein [Niallia taxi]|uniref:hypothetical protein n=1 Tax=Niallia taxi TaxID=2499688 RepID=UPI0015F53D3B|nr:hypothetical protein [Niallia taxi]